MNIFNSVNKAEIHVHLEATIFVEDLQNEITLKFRMNFLAQNMLISGMIFMIS